VLFDDRQWESIGVYAVTQGWARVQLRDSGNNFYVAGDAVRIEKIKNDITVLAIDKAIDSESVTVTVSVTENIP
jgi:type II secretory pathway component GspD/PulD (secretin)